jgi:site-specific DNA-methyltransferase (adenine-specific)
MSEPAILHLADCLKGAPRLQLLGPRSVDHVIADPPYSAYVHEKIRTGLTVSRRPGGSRLPISAHADLGFASLDADTRRRVARAFGRIAKRWVLVFSDVEGSHLWRRDLEAAGLVYVRTGGWRREGGAPQFSGDRPAQAFDAIVICHQAGEKLRWNGGGRPAFWSCPTAIDRDKSGRDKREHPTQKPLELMRALVRDFTDPGELVCDPFAGAASTGVAAVELGRSFLGWEREEKWHRAAKRRLSAARYQTEILWPLWRARRRRRQARPHQVEIPATALEAPPAAPECAA